MERKLSRMLLGIAAIAMVAGCSTGPNVSSFGMLSSSSATKIGRFDAQFRRSTHSVVHFGFDQDLLTTTAIAKLESQAAWIMAHPDLKFSVTGHTDKVGNQAYNFDLGMRRAQRVLAYLVAKGIDPDRLIAMVSMGEDDPVIDTEDRALANRRVVTEVIGMIPRAGGSATNDGGDGLSFIRDSAPDTSASSSNDKSDDSGDDQVSDLGNGGGGGIGGFDTQSSGGNENNSDGTGAGNGGGGTGGSDNQSSGGDENNSDETDAGNGNGGQSGNNGNGGQAGNNGNGGQGGNNGNGGSNANSSQSSSNPSSDRNDAGRGNGAESGDPGKSGGHNNGGDAD